MRSNAERRADAAAVVRSRADSARAAAQMEELVNATAEPPRIEADTDGVPLVLVDLAGDELHVTAWGLARAGRVAVLALTEDGEPPTMPELQAVAEQLETDPNAPEPLAGSRAWLAEHLAMAEQERGELKRYVASALLRLNAARVEADQLRGELARTEEARRVLAEQSTRLALRRLRSGTWTLVRLRRTPRNDPRRAAR